MIKVEKIETWGFEHAIRGMRNPKNSWDKSDSEWKIYMPEYPNLSEAKYIVGPNDLGLMRRLYSAGPEHRKYLRQIFVSMDITAPLYWWKEFDTYKIGTTADSCSTMHKIHAKEFERTDFSCEHLPKGSDAWSDTWELSTSKNMVLINRDDSLYLSACDLLDLVIRGLNHFRKKYLDTKDKDMWWQMIQLLPSSYNQKRTVTFTYENVVSMIRQRSGHKLDEWREFVEILKDLPYVREIIADETNNVCRVEEASKTES